MHLLTFGCLALLFGGVSQASTHLQPKPEKSQTYAEMISFVGDMADGTYIHLQMGLTNVGLGSRNGVCRALVIDPAGKRSKAASSFGKGDWAYESGATETFRMKDKCAIVADSDSVSLTLKLDEMDVAVALKSGLSSIRPPDGRVEVDGEFYESTLLVPGAGAHVTFTLAGATTRSLDGRGFMDRSRSTTKPRQIAERWVRVRRLAAGNRFLALVRFPPEGEPPRGWTWREGQSAPTPLASASLVSVGDRRWRAVVDGNTFDTGPVLLRNAPLEDIKFIGGMVRMAIGNTVTYTSRSAGGVMEVTIVDE